MRLASLPRCLMVRRSPRLSLASATGGAPTRQQSKLATAKRTTGVRKKTAGNAGRGKQTAAVSSEHAGAGGQTVAQAQLGYERRAFGKMEKAKMVAGVDEAGRGPLCGPVVAAAVAVDARRVDEMLAFLGDDAARIDDSKRLTEKDRDELYERIVRAPGLTVARSFVDARTIDDINILQATMRGMREAVADVNRSAAAAVGHVFVDGNRVPENLGVPSAEAVVGGDGKVWCIAAASIVAKVERDRYMVALDARFPQYNLKQHKGYGTAAHMEAIHKHGPIDEHRRSFAPIKGVEKWARVT